MMRKCDEMEAYMGRDCVETHAPRAACDVMGGSRSFCLLGFMQPAIGLHIGPVRAFFQLLATIFIPSDGYSRNQPLDADQGDHAFDVIGQHVLRHFGAHVFQTANQEMGGPHRLCCNRASVTDKRGR